MDSSNSEDNITENYQCLSLYHSSSQAKLPLSLIDQCHHDPTCKELRYFRSVFCNKSFLLPFWKIDLSWPASSDN